MRGLLLAIAMLAIIMGACAASWSGYVKTDTSDWYIYRHGGNLSFDYTQSVEGTVSPIDIHGRVVSPYHSLYADVDVNDVRLRERTAAYEGSLSSEETISLCSSINSSIYRNITKPAGSPLYTVTFQEKWPVTLNATRTLDYLSRGINDRGFAGNNLDYAGSSLLYNAELSREQRVSMELKRLNATILATDEDLLHAELQATRTLDSQIAAHTTGIADLSYRQAGPDYQNKMGTYQVLAEGEERYQGTYDINRGIQMNSSFQKTREPLEWLPCCSGGWEDLLTYRTNGYTSGYKGIFDCTCHRPVGLLQVIP
ncbi:MAG: hypothetical protein GKC10_04810 [Methanosarcinales archaeon]|nr:hypothetical protein [Methanosarcinales archaeon]